MATHWTADDIPSQAGRLVLITGGNSGIGFHAARHLARAGAEVILSGRDMGRVNAARDRILREQPNAQVHALHLDLASFRSIRQAAQLFYSGGSRLDLLINNAGVMALPDRRLTEDGFEMQIGTNHLGHFLLTGLLMPALLGAPAARIVTVSSIAHRGGSIRLEDLNWQTGYDPWKAYRQSKLANLLFGIHLDRKLYQAGSRARSLVVHPGIANTNLFQGGPGSGDGLLAKIIPKFIAITSQSDEQGSLPTLYAATEPTVEGGHFYGPDGFQQLRGYPAEVQAEPQAYDVPLAECLWNLSEELTGVHYEFKTARLAQASGD
jgi:NAD(P)-dependent dehydrogenase (short-subunit alcohol dehydrogenase family)